MFHAFGLADAKHFPSELMGGIKDWLKVGRTLHVLRCGLAELKAQ